MFSASSVAFGADNYYGALGNGVWVLASDVDIPGRHECIFTLICLTHGRVCKLLHDLLNGAWKEKYRCKLF
jgi:hypothetical protein